jgi:acyl-homoserine lactone acylase PvdQ
MQWLKRLAWGLLFCGALVALALAVYVWRSFPVLTGEQRVQGLQGSVRITRDAADVTHIFATNETDVTVLTGGDPWTVNVGQYWPNEAQPFRNRHAASMRTVFDLADLEKSQFIYQTGQSGLVFSSHYRDMSPAWSNAGYRSLQLQSQNMVSELVLKP